MAQDRLKIAEDGPKVGPRSPTIAQDEPKIGPRWGHEKFKITQDGAQERFKIAGDEPKIAEDGPRSLQMG